VVRINFEPCLVPGDGKFSDSLWRFFPKFEGAGRGGVEFAEMFSGLDSLLVFEPGRRPEPIAGVFGGLRRGEKLQDDLPNDGG